MNFNIRVGQDNDGNDILLDFQKENLHSVILTGETGSGKGMFHSNLYRQLIEQNSVEDLGFVFMDMTQVDFKGWNTPYLCCPTIVDTDKALSYLVELGNESIRRSLGISDARKTIVIHIEECDMACRDLEKFEKAWLNIANNRDRNNMYIIFSSSRPSPKDVFTKTIIDSTDLRVVCKLASTIDSMHVIGKSLAENFIRPGEKVCIYKDTELYLDPFTKTEVDEINRFDRTMWPF